ncbi:MAG: rhodanese-like domain-containing protein [Bacilli bacterium]|nr:rhodanese-like domain-containing protein [Bacilli bacterium]
MSNITIDELLPMIGKIKIIDIRNNQCYNNNHIPTSINIPFEKLICKPSEYLNAMTKYFIYCRCGLISKKACQILSNYGYKVVNILGGYEEWVLKN